MEKINNTKNIRDLFCGVDELLPCKDGKYIKPINFDNGATTPAFKCVLKYIEEFMPLYAAVGRSDGYKSKFSTKIYELSKEIVTDFFNINNKDDYEVIYVKNTTEGINMLSNLLINSKEEVVITTRMEHHSNDLPWRKKCKVIYGQILENGRLDLESIEKIFELYKDKIKLISVTGASNVTGFVSDIHYLAKLAHKNNAYIIVDGAQLVPHKEVFLEGKESDDYIDFIAFSAHKMYAPFGIGAVIGRKEILSNLTPDYVGGGQVKIVTDNKVIYKNSSERFEAGTQNLIGAIALISAMKMIRSIGFSTIETMENKLLYELISGLQDIPRIRLYGEDSTRERLGIVVFNIDDVHHEKIGSILASEGISVRTGCFCAQPYAKRLLRISDAREQYYLMNPDDVKAGMVRVSLGIYNTSDEICRFLNIMEYISKHVYI